MLELCYTGGHDRGAGRLRVRADEQVVAANWRYTCSRLGTDSAVLPICADVERQYIDLAAQVFDGLKQPF